MKPRDYPLESKVEHGVPSITIGVATLAFAYKELMENQIDELGGDARVGKVTKPTMFAKDVLYEMGRETEAGNSPLTDFIDKMMVSAVDEGSIAIELDEELP